MARWSLKDKHYLQVEGTEWEYREIGNTGKQRRVVMPVPMYLDPSDPADWTHAELGLIIVSNKPSDDPRVLIFTGPPSPDMEPLDAEAEALSAEASKAWVHPIESLSGQIYGDKLMNMLGELAAMKASSAPTSAIPDREAALEAQNAELAAKLAAYQAAAESPELPLRRP